VKTLFDTSVLVAGLVGSLPAHERAFTWLQRAKTGELEFLVATHSLAELYSVLSTLPARPRISPADAQRLVHENVGSTASLISLSAADYRSTLVRMAELGLSGGAVYDALIARAAEKSGAERLLTLNPDDFRRVWPEGKSRIHVP